MSDTATKRVMKPRDVNYEMKAVGELPPSVTMVRTSQLRDNLDAIKANPQAHKMWVQIASYAESGAAASAAGNLRKAFGFNANYLGWEFAHGREADTGDTPRTALFAKYDPDAVTETGKTEHNQELAKRAARVNSGKKGRPKKEV